MHRGYRISFTILIIGIVGLLFWYTSTSVPSVPANEDRYLARLSNDDSVLLGEIGADETFASSTEATSTPILEIKDGVYEVIFTADGFSPKISTIKVGETIIFKNESRQKFAPASNPHPAHTDLKNFDAKKSLNPGESYKFTFTRAGTWRYHDHEHPELGGTVVVLK